MAERRAAEKKAYGAIQMDVNKRKKRKGKGQLLISLLVVVRTFKLKDFR